LLQQQQQQQEKSDAVVTTLPAKAAAVAEGTAKVASTTAVTTTAATAIDKEKKKKKSEFHGMDELGVMQNIYDSDDSDDLYGDDDDAAAAKPVVPSLSHRAAFRSTPQTPGARASPPTMCSGNSSSSKSAATEIVEDDKAMAKQLPQLPQSDVVMQERNGGHQNATAADVVVDGDSTMTTAAAKDTPASQLHEVALAVIAEESRVTWTKGSGEPIDMSSQDMARGKLVFDALDSGTGAASVGAPLQPKTKKQNKSDEKKKEAASAAPPSVQPKIVADAKVVAAAATLQQQQQQQQQQLPRLLYDALSAHFVEQASSAEVSTLRAQLQKQTLEAAKLRATLQRDADAKLAAVRTALRKSQGSLRAQTLETEKLQAALAQLKQKIAVFSSSFSGLL
jgi:hypothetical protein